MEFSTRRSLVRDLRAIGLGAGDAVMIHAGLRSVGRIIGGPDALIRAVLDATGPGGTVMAYTDWNGGFDNFWDPQGRVPEELRDELDPFDPKTSRAVRDNGAWPELLRTYPGTLRSGTPGASMAALGERAQFLTENHPLDYGYGEGSPLAKLVEIGGKVLMLGAPLDTMTILHHAEHLAKIPGKRVIRYETPFLEDGAVVWRWIEEFDTSDPVVEGLADDYFAAIVEEFLATGRGVRGRIGQADSVLVDAAEIVPFGVAWLESRFG